MKVFCSFIYPFNFEAIFFKTAKENWCIFIKSDFELAKMENLKYQELQVLQLGRGARARIRISTNLGTTMKKVLD